MMGRTLLAWIFALVLATMATAGPTEDLREAQKAVTAAALALADSQKDACIEAPPDTTSEEEPPPSTGNECGTSADCQYLNTKCITGGFWEGWCVDEPANFTSDGRMTHNANCLRRPPRLDKRTIQFRFDVKFDQSWITNCVARGQHLGGVWAAFGEGKTKREWVKRNIRVDFSRQCSDGFDAVIQGYKNDSGTEALNVVMDTRINARVAGVFQAGQWRTVIVTATYEPSLGKVSGTVEYVGAGVRSFSHTDPDAKDYPVFWNWEGFGNVDNSPIDSAPRASFGAQFRNVSSNVF